MQKPEYTRETEQSDQPGISGMQVNTRTIIVGALVLFLVLVASFWVYSEFFSLQAQQERAAAEFRKAFDAEMEATESWDPWGLKSNPWGN